MGKTWASQINSWNQLVQAGQGVTVARELQSIPRGKIPVELLAKIANLCWRINRPKIGLRLLFPELRRQANLKITGHPDTFTEYAGCLIESGALSEARTILRETSRLTPRSKFYLALLHFKEWNYEAACPILEEYLGQIPADYHQIVVRVNLAATYVITERFDKAERLFKDLRAELSQKQHWLLLGNTFEIESQMHYQLGAHAASLRCLAESERLLGNTRNMGWLYCKKWQFLNRLRANPNASFAAERIHLAETAREMGSWETMRELDLNWGLTFGDQQLVNKVYFGSPLRLYRERIRGFASHAGLTIGDGFTWKSSLNTASPTAPINFDDVLSNDDAPTFLIGKLLSILTSDFYAPFRVGQLFSKLFETEYYDVERSPDRVFQLVRRLREWLQENGEFCNVETLKTGYRLRLSENQKLLLSRRHIESGAPTRSNVHQLFVRETFGAREFSSSDLGGRLGCSTRSANRILKDLCDAGQVQTSGKGRRTRFKIAA